MGYKRVKWLKSNNFYFVNKSILYKSKKNCKRSDFAIPISLFF